MRSTSDNVGLLVAIDHGRAVAEGRLLSYLPLVSPATHVNAGIRRLS
jgi:hypothetical protein